MAAPTIPTNAIMDADVASGATGRGGKFVSAIGVSNTGAKEGADRMLYAIAAGNRRAIQHASTFSASSPCDRYAGSICVPLKLVIIK